MSIPFWVGYSVSHDFDNSVNLCNIPSNIVIAYGIFRSPISDPSLSGGGGFTPSPTKSSKSSISGGSTTNSKLFATCFVCGKQLSNQYNLRVHMETHQNAFYACSSCSHVSRSRDALRKHVSYRHPHVSPWYPHYPTCSLTTWNFLVFP